MKDYLKSGMIPGMGSLRDELNKIPGVRPSPVGQENVPVSNPASCPSMNYSPNNYRGHQTHSQPAPDSSYHQQNHYHQMGDQYSNRSGSGSMSSSSNSLNNDFYPQSANHANVNQGYINPIYQVTPQNFPEMSTGYAQADGAAMTKNANYPTANNYQQPATMQTSGLSQYANFSGNYVQQQQQQMPATQQYDYYKNQGFLMQQPTSDNFQTVQQPNMNYSQTSTNNSYLNPSINSQQHQANNDQIQNPYQNQYHPSQQYPNTPSPAQHQQQYSAAPAPNFQQQNLQQQQQYSVAQNTAPQLY